MDVQRTRLSTVGDRAFPVVATPLMVFYRNDVTAAPLSSLSSTSTLILNHISFHFLIPLSDSIAPTFVATNLSNGVCAYAGLLVMEGGGGSKPYNVVFYYS